MVARTTSAAETSPPNFVLVMADDLGFGDIGPFGAKKIATPNLDRMAAEGVKLTRFYASANVCTPSRAGLLTGRYSIRMGLAKEVLFPKSPNGLPPEEVTIAKALKERGYKTACIGKWHLGNKPEFWPTHHGFDFYYGLPYSNDMTPLALYRGEEKIEESVQQETLTERYTAEATKFIEANKSTPFFVYLPHTMPHVPIYVSEKFKGRSKASLYGDAVETIDWGMGEIFATLKRLGLDEKTLVIFTSDNGPWYEGSSGVYRDRKGSSWEGGLHVPFLARWPGKIPAGKTSDAIAMNIDMLPTLLKLAGVDLPKVRVIDGKDIWGLLQGGGDSPHDALYFFTNEKIAAVRTPRWKFVLSTFYRTNEVNLNRAGAFYAPGLLFDMNDEEEERYSVAREHPDVVAQMVKLLEKGNAELVEPNTKKD